MNHATIPVSASEQLRLMIDDTDAFMRQVFVPHDSNLQFQVEGVLFHTKYYQNQAGFQLQIWTTLGYLPYSLESASRRQVLIAILEHLRYNAKARFGVNKEYQIVCTQTYTIKDIQPPLFIFIPLLDFLKETLPYLRLIGECM